MSAKADSLEQHPFMEERSFVVFHSKDAGMKEYALHHHDFFEIYFFETGNVEYIIEGRSYTLCPGDILLIAPMELHQPMFRQGQQMYERSVLWINRRLMEGLGHDLTACFDSAAPGHSNLLRPDQRELELLRFQLEELGREQESEDFCSDLYCVACLAQLMIQLNRIAQRQKALEQKKTADSVVYSVLAYINRFYTEDLSLDVLAQRFFISKYHLSREFKRLMGIPVHRYLTQKRLAVARQLMTEGLPSTEVYQRCGFGDYSTFYRAFRTEYQIAPKAFVRQLSEKPTATGLLG